MSSFFSSPVIIAFIKKAYPPFFFRDKVILTKGGSKEPKGLSGTERVV